METEESETSPICLSDQINILAKFQLPRSPHFGFRAFESFMGLVFFTHPSTMAGVQESDREDDEEVMDDGEDDSESDENEMYSNIE